MCVAKKAQCMQGVLEWLAAQPGVQWLAPRAQVRLANWQGSAITQSASAAPAAPVTLIQVAFAAKRQIETAKSDMASPSCHAFIAAMAVRHHAVLRSTASTSQDSDTHPIWAAGLTGSGQVIGGGDSGVGDLPALPQQLACMHAWC